MTPTFILGVDSRRWCSASCSRLAIVIGIIYLFLRSVRITFIPAVTVPVALIGTIAAM